MTMMLVGRIVKEDDAWIAECDAAGAYTFGRSREDAMFMLANCIETLLGTNEFDVTVHETGTEPDGSIAVVVKATRFGPLAARVLRYQREVSGLTQQEAAAKSGVEDASQSDWAMYERGERVPSIEKFGQMLAAVTDEWELTVGPKRAK